MTKDSTNEKCLSALDVANFLVYLLKDVYDDVTNMKVNKLLYYAQGHYLKLHGTPLFQEKIYAWDHGPLIKEVYGKYKEYEERPIQECDEVSANMLDDDIKSFLLDIARVYGRYTAPALRAMTHVPHSPWDETTYKNEIPLSLINDYFAEHEDLLEPLQLNFDEDSFIGYHDESGAYVLPEEWNGEKTPPFELRIAG